MNARSLLELLRPTRPLLAGFVVVCAAAAVVALKGGPGPSGPGLQPIAFNHAKHIGAGMNCTDCHTGAAGEEHATLPALATCMACHATPMTQSAEERRLHALAAAGTEPEWRPVTQVPPHVFFSHRRHVSLGKLACSACHGAMERLAAPPRAPLVPITMQNCIDCHRQAKAGSECNDCHR